MQGGGGGRGHPGAGGARHGMADLGLQHVGHADRAWPTCPCRSAPCPAGRSSGRYPHSGPRKRSARSSVFISPLRTIGAGIHRGMHLVAGAVQEAGIDEDDAVLHGADALPSGWTQVRRSSSITPIFMVLRATTEHILDAVEQRVGERDFGGAVHLGLDDIDRTLAAVAAACRPLMSCSAIRLVTTPSIRPSRNFAAVLAAGWRRWSSGGRHCG